MPEGMATGGLGYRGLVGGIEPEEESDGQGKQKGQEDRLRKAIGVRVQFRKSSSPLCASANEIIL